MQPKRTKRATKKTGPKLPACFYEPLTDADAINFRNDVKADFLAGDITASEAEAMVKGKLAPAKKEKAAVRKVSRAGVRSASEAPGAGKEDGAARKPSKARKVPAGKKSNVHPKTAKKVAKTEAITPVISAQLQQAFDFFNKELWDGALPQVVLLFARKPRSYGYFWAERWGKGENADVHEIALNPDHMRKAKAKAALSTVAHEMAHLWQFVFGEKCPKRPYHNKEFANEMERIGLMTSSTGEPGGKRTGQSMTHYVIDGGPFDKAADKLLKSGFKWDWSSFPVPPVESKSGKRIKYECPEGCKAWGKEGLNITCEDHDEHMEAA